MARHEFFLPRVPFHRVTEMKNVGWKLVLVAGISTFLFGQAQGAVVDWMTWDPNLVNTAGGGIAGYDCQEKGRPTASETYTTSATGAGGAKQVVLTTELQWFNDTSTYRTFAGDGAYCFFAQNPNTVIGVYYGAAYGYHGRIWSSTDTDNYIVGNLRGFTGVFNIGSTRDESTRMRYIYSDITPVSEYASGKSPYGQYAIGITDKSAMVAGVYGISDVQNNIILASTGGQYVGDPQTSTGGPGLLISGWDRNTYSNHDVSVLDNSGNRVSLTTTGGLTTEGSAFTLGMTRITGNLRVAIDGATLGVMKSFIGIMP